MRFAFAVHGRVQGVGFRYFVLEKAQDLGILGWVRNDYDGSVTGEAFGDGARLEEFRDWLARGPRMAHVSRLDWMPLVEGQSLPHSFEIRR